jgi:hypothetical protein
MRKVASPARYSFPLDMLQSGLLVTLVYLQAPLQL